MTAEVSFSVLDKRYRLRYGNNALAELENLLGLNITKIGERLTKGSIGVRDLRAFLWAGLIYQHPGLKITEVGDLMDEMGLEKVGEIINDAFERAFPKLEMTMSKEVQQSPKHGSGMS